MFMWWAVPDPALQVEKTAATAPARPPAGRRQSDRSIDPTERACCCQAPPGYRVLVPVGAGRVRTVDLLLCAHHYHRSRDALTRIGAGVYDTDGVLVA
jgi:hypothetical protein